MTIIQMPPAEVVTMDARTEMARCLTAAAAFIAVHDVPLPGAGKVYLSIRVPPGERGERIEALQRIAEKLGTTLVKRHGTLFAEREFGPVVVLEAHLRDTATWTRCASEADVDRTADRWEADGEQVRRLGWVDSEQDYEARRIEGGRVVEVAWWCPFPDAPEAAQAVTATGSAA